MNPSNLHLNLNSMVLLPFLLRVLLVEELRHHQLVVHQEEALHQLLREEDLQHHQDEELLHHQDEELLHFLQEEHQEEVLQLLMVRCHQVEEFLLPLQEDHQHLEVHQLLLLDQMEEGLLEEGLLGEDHLAEDNLAEDHQEEVLQHLLFRI